MTIFWGSLGGAVIWLHKNSQALRIMPDYPDYPSIGETHKISPSANKRKSQINSQTSLKQHLPLATSAHPLKGSHRWSMRLTASSGARLKIRSVQTGDADTNKTEKHAKIVRSLCKAPVVSVLLGLTTVNQPAATQRSLKGEAAISSAAEWSARYITSKVWPRSGNDAARLTNNKPEVSWPVFTVME